MLALVMTVAAQDIPPPPREPVETLRVDTTLVNMIFSVRNTEGRLVPGLRREQLRVTDNGQPQKITHFAEESNQPLALAVVLDESASVKSHFDFERQATADFVRSILRPGKDQALLIAFSKKPHLAVAFTDRVEGIEQGMAGLKAEGGTALFDAARLAIEYLSGAGAKRKVLVLVTDGEDTVSWTTRDEVLSVALSRDVIIYTLGVKPDGPGNHREGHRTLVRLSEETGGAALFPKDDPKELAQLFGRLEDELRHQYSLGYLPPPNGGTFHRVNIESSEKSHRIQTRRGYYAASAAVSNSEEIDR